MCACSSASVSIVDKLKSVEPKGKCPLCREAGVYEGAVPLEELRILLRRRCSEYWEERRQAERLERMRLIKQHWDNQTKAMMGI